LGESLHDPHDQRLEDGIHGSALTLLGWTDDARADVAGWVRYRMNSGARTREIVASSFTRTWSDGPAVSLNGSPTVSPTTAAAWASEPLPRTLPWSSLRCPDSMYFLALSHAPPPLLRTVASRTPAIVPTISMPATASKPRMTPIAIGVATATRPGRIICRRAAAVVMSTTRA